MGASHASIPPCLLVHENFAAGSASLRCGRALTDSLRPGCFITYDAKSLHDLVKRHPGDTKVPRCTCAVEAGSFQLSANERSFVSVNSASQTGAHALAFSFSRAMAKASARCTSALRIACEVAGRV